MLRKLALSVGDGGGFRQAISLSATQNLHLGVFASHQLPIGPHLRLRVFDTVLAEGQDRHVLWEQHDIIPDSTVN